ncbi:hypothetical protein [Actinomyces howellii]|nr:hypothetical protein [Actinomyces howellii]
MPQRPASRPTSSPRSAPSRPAPASRRQASRSSAPRGQRLSSSARSGSRGRGGRRAPGARLGGVLGLGAVAFVVTVLVGLLATRPLGADDAPATATAAGPAPVVLDTEGFDPALLIDDEVFYDSTTMSLEEIASFIEEVNAGCRPGSDSTPCLAQASFDTEDQDPTVFCPGGYTGARSQSVAQIIAEVAASCDLNPQVLLVLIQKEQGLLTASGSTLTARDYEAAAGYACPDGAACDARYAGFFRQLYGAASQFQRYRVNPGEYDVVAGRTTSIAYSPDPTCGAAELTIANQATAGLYNYTPYQPNAQAASGGDACTSWGNWSFYGYFRTFFGDPTPSSP